jgi:hypothetical protein
MGMYLGRNGNDVNGLDKAVTDVFVEAVPTVMAEVPQLISIPFQLLRMWHQLGRRRHGMYRFALKIRGGKIGLRDKIARLGCLVRGRC